MFPVTFYSMIPEVDLRLESSFALRARVRQVVVIVQMSHVKILLVEAFATRCALVGKPSSVMRSMFPQSCFALKRPGAKVAGEAL